MLDKAVMRQLNNNKYFNTQFKKQGFTLIEILVALVLIAFILSISITSPFSSRADLDKEVNSIERAIRFMSDESALKNSVIRLHFILDKSPQEYAVEYGPSDTFILPSKPDFETTVESREEVDKRKKIQKDLNMKFSRVPEFQDRNMEINGDIRILGIASSQSTKLQTKGEASIYAFPTGEKDEALVILASDEDIITLKVSPFSLKIIQQVYPLGKIDQKEIQVVQEEKAKKIFETWLKEK